MKLCINVMKAKTVVCKNKKRQWYSESYSGKPDLNSFSLSPTSIGLAYYINLLFLCFAYSSFTQWICICDHMLALQTKGSFAISDSTEHFNCVLELKMEGKFQYDSSMIHTSHLCVKK